jgi:nucleoid-associated protein YgaU
MPDRAPSKLMILAFTKPNFTGNVGQYVANVNPGSYKATYSIDYDRKPALGSAGTVAKFNHVPPVQMDFELLFDATGVLAGSPNDVATEINAFLDIVYNYHGNIHEPYYLKLVWGRLAFGARLSSLAIDYTLFKPNGAPLRAKAQTSFISSIDADTLTVEMNPQSPDVTHEITVRAGDSLPLLCERVYGDATQYLGIARYNRLPTVLYVPPGTRLTFPPLQELR